MARLLAVLTTLALATVSGVQAQPARDGNIWNGFDHEPNPTIVHREEQTDGIAPSLRQQKQLDNDVENTARELLNQQRTMNSLDQTGLSSQRP